MFVFSGSKSQTERCTAAVSLATNRLVRIEYCLAIVLTLLAVCLHALFMLKAGGLWRDESNSVFLALKPTLMDTWTASKTDSFPILSLLVIRAWSIFFGSSDLSLRALGFGIGISILIALWFNSRETGSRVTYISLLFIGINPVIIRSVDSLRPYGVSALATIIGFTVVWRAVQSPTISRLSWMTFVLILWAQSLYQSAFLILALGIAALSVGYLRGGFKRTLLLVIPFIIAAGSLLPYADHIKASSEWSVVAMMPEGMATPFSGLNAAVRSPEQWFVWIWVLLGTLVVIGAVARVLLNKRSEAQNLFDLSLFCLLTIVISTAAFLLFITKMANIDTHYWHFTPLLILLVISSGPLVEQVVCNSGAKILTLSVVAGVAVAVMFSAAKTVSMRMTSIDLLAASICQEAKPADIVVISPWFLGVSFNRYYKGTAPWVTFPALKDKELHRFDLLKERMRHPESISEDISRILSVLKRGGTVWVVGDIYSLDPDIPIKPLPPAPLLASAWSSIPYVANWSDHLIFTLASHAKNSNILRVDTVVNARQRLNPLESPRVALIHGWVD